MGISGSTETSSLSGAESIDKEGSSEENTPEKPEKTRPVKEKKVSHNTTHHDLNRLKKAYNIHEDIHLKILGKRDTPSRPPKGCVTLYLKCFKLGVRLPLQSYFVRVLGRMHLAPGLLNPNGWRILSDMFVLWKRCELGEPTVNEIKNLYQLRNSPKDTS